MRFFLVLACVVVSFVSDAKLAFAQCETGETVLKIGGFFDATHFARHRASSLLRETINKEMQGKACAEYLTNQTKYTGTLGITALQSGEINLFAADLSELGNFLPEYRVYELPFAFRDLAALEKFQSLTLGEFTKVLEPRDLQPLGYWHKGFEQVASSRAALSADMVAGMKFRRDSSNAFGAMLTSLNAVSISVPENDLNVALKQKRVDAVTARWQEIQFQKMATLLGNVSETNHRFEGYQVLAQKSWWAKLEPDLQKSLGEIIVRVSRQVNFETASRAEGFRRTVIRSGGKTWALTQDQRATWLAALSNAYADFFTPARASIKRFLDEANSGL